MKHLRLFETESDYELEKSNMEYPTVSYTSDNLKSQWKQENYLIATYNVKVISAIDLFNPYSLDVSQVKSMKVDRIEIEPVGEYAFTSTGEHKVRMDFLEPLKPIVHNYTVNRIRLESGLFSCCYSLSAIDLSNLDTSNLSDMSYMFGYCSSLTSVIMTTDVSNVTDVSDMFLNVSTTGTFYYNSAYDYSKIIAALPSTWTAVAV